MIESKTVSMSHFPCKCCSRSPSPTTDTSDNNEETTCRYVMVIFDFASTQELKISSKSLFKLLMFRVESKSSVVGSSVVE